MKKIVLALLIGFCGFAQETEFKFSKEGFTDYVVTEVPGKTQSELYKKAIDWVSVTYKNPKEVIKAQIENDYIRIQGASSTLVIFNVLGSKTYYDSRYQIEISFKDGKYKFDVIEIEFYTSPSKYGAGGWGTLTLTPADYMYNKKGEIKGNYKYFPETLTTYFNSLNKELEAFLKSDAIPSKKSDW